MSKLSFYFIFESVLGVADAMHTVCTDRMLGAYSAAVAMHSMHIPILSHDHTSMHLALTLIASIAHSARLN